MTELERLERRRIRALRRRDYAAVVILEGRIAALVAAERKAA